MANLSEKYTINTPVNSALVAGSTPVYTSAIYVQAGALVNVGIAVGSVTAAGSLILGGSWTGSIWLQRQLSGDEVSNFWRNRSLFTAADEFITSLKVVENCYYRLGVEGNGMTAGEAVLRIGTT